MASKKRDTVKNLKPKLTQNTQEIKSIKSYLWIIVVAFVVLILVFAGVFYLFSKDEAPAPEPQIIIQQDFIQPPEPEEDLDMPEEPMEEPQEPELPEVIPPEEPEPVSEVIQLDESSLELKQGETREGLVFIKNTASVFSEMSYAVAFTSAPPEMATQFRELKEWFVDIPKPKKLSSKETWDAPYTLVIPEDAVLGDYEATFEVVCDAAQCGDEETAVLKLKISVV